MTERPGWGWVVAGLENIPRVATRYRAGWDGLFTADCPCGRTGVDWDAFQFLPLCTCPAVFATHPEVEPWTSR